MRRLYFLGLFAMFLFVSACKRLDKLVSFNLETNNRVAWQQVSDSVLYDSIPGNEIINQVSADYKFGDNEKFEINGCVPQNTEEVEKWGIPDPVTESVVNFTMTLDSGATNFGFMRNLNVYLSSTTNQFPEELIANLPFPDPVANVLSFNMEPSNEYFLSAIQKNGYRFRTEYELIGAMPDSIVLSYEMKFRVKALPND